MKLKEVSPTPVTVVSSAEADGCIFARDCRDDDVARARILNKGVSLGSAPPLRLEPVATA
eukprot:CAMPEP_0206038972 /NCGR_PEP_ID=MMETSP1466-20131121/4454_1 /ASSEMBLY_ACC=CAM_ASM_001126 /TAXON_ID=44452 /ORGANISM="Pavlova gyrans, Strain CCMP608" /LENGTH=59 /DNA_ID=CAMNT_0053413589 /DNA_START=320 /DNA_END=499 /DNA_ORIENTATION=+